jgi:hypothetical protein
VPLLPSKPPFSKRFEDAVFASGRIEARRIMRLRQE